MRGLVLDFLKSYLSNKKQFVNTNGLNSANSDITYGVPQGSVLGPLFFNIYANEISSLNLGLDVIQYADDTVLVCSGKVLAELSNKSNNALQIFRDWCCFNKLALNINKTKYMLFSPVTCHVQPVLSIGGTDLERVNEYKYLGILIDDKLKFNNHINVIKTKISRLGGITFKIGKFLSVEAARNFYYAMVQSIISYNIVFWGASSKTLLNELQRKQNVVVRNLFQHHFSRNLSTSQLYNNMKLLKIGDFHKYSVALTFFKAVYLNKFPLVLEAVLNHAWIHNYNTRRVHLFRLPLTRVEPDLNCFLYQAMSLFNTLPQDIRECNSLNSFKHKLNVFLRREY